MLSRRNLLRSSALGLAGAALAACTTTTSGGVTTDTVNVAKILSIITSVESGLAQVLGSSTAVSILGTSTVSKLQGYVTTVSKITGEVAAETASSISVTVAQNWITTAESAASAAVTLLEGFSALLPTPVNTIVLAVAALLPTLEALIGAVSATRATAALTQAQAQAIIAAGL